MRKSLSLILTLFVSTSVLIPMGTHAGGKWSYSGSTGPDNWAKVGYGACAGKNQSPINLTGFVEANLTPVVFNFQAGGKEILNNGHTVQVNYAKGSSIQIDGKTFNLQQFHFHAPSENHIGGKSYPMEAHFVHASRDGHLAVVALMFKEGAPNKGLANAWARMPKKAGNKNRLSARVDANEILPSKRDYYRFNGSLTTPPCSEGVRWLVLKQAATASKAQIAKFAEALHEPNNRPLQALNSRLVLK
jgi:carbonic anhydrase